MQTLTPQWQNLADTNSLDGTPERIYLSPPHISAEEKRLVQEALESNWVAPEGPHVEQFEECLREYLNQDYVLALNSGTSSIHLGLKLMGVGPGDFVIAPSFTFCAAVNPILYLGARPVFVDCEIGSWGIDPALLESAIIDCSQKEQRPKAIIMVHNYGHPARVEEIMKIARTHDIPVLEDAAEAIGSNYYGQLAGSFGHYAALSFNGNKLLTTGGGGALVLPDGEAYEKARKWATQSKEAKPYYHHTELGYNYRIGNMAAALGIAQYGWLAKRIELKKKIYHQYRTGLSQFEFFSEVGGSVSNHWLSILLLPENAQLTSVELSESLNRLNIESRPVWQPLHEQPLYSDYLKYVDGTAARLFKQGVCLPSGSSLREDQVEFISRAVRQLLR